MRKDRVRARNAKLVQELDDAVFSMLPTHALHHGFRFGDMRADAERLVVRKAANLFQ